MSELALFKPVSFVTEPTEKSECLSKSSETSGYDSDTESSSSDDDETSGCWPTLDVLAQKSKLL